MPRSPDPWWRRFCVALHLPGPIVALVAAINAATAGLQGWQDLAGLLQNLVTYEITGFTIAYACKWLRPWERGWTLAWMVLATALGATFGMGLSVAVKLLCGLRTPADYLGHWGDLVGTTIFVAWHSLLVCALVVYQLLDRRRQAALHRADVDQSVLARRVAEAELKLLQAQIEPHFLFNTLSNLQYLVETDPPAAARMLQHLSTYLRAAIPQLRQASSTLGREMQLVQAYLAIFEMRLGRRLRSQVELPEALRELAMPPMMLLTLVENAIQHGIEPTENGGAVWVRAELQGQRLVVSVTDTGQGLAPTAAHGVGLANIRERLRALYGSAARLELRAQAPSGVRAEIELPAERCPQQPAA